MTRILCCLLLFAGAVGQAIAQGIQTPDNRVGVVYNYETAFNLKITTNRGYAPGMEWGRLRTYYKTTYYYLNAGELKHPKEQRQSADPSVSRSFRAYVYGKQHNAMIVRGGWGVKRYYTEKAKYKGVAVGMSYGVGPSISLLKPYYLALRRPSPDNPGNSRVRHERYTAENADIFLDNTRILGASPFTKGLGEISFVPGGSASVALHLDWGAFDELVKALEVGAILDVFPRKLPILVSEENDRFFLNFFINFQFGKRR